MKKKLWIVGMSAIVLASCGGSDESTDTNESNETADTTATEEVVEIDGIDPFPDFPKGNTSAAAGDIILTPSKVWQEDATRDGGENQTFIFYNATMNTPAEGKSIVDFMFDSEIEIPNYMIIPIKSNQTAKKGDILLTWWQSGSGMQRAIVTDASNPSEPVVNYIDLDWDHPATNDDGLSLGQSTEPIKPNTFHVLSSLWEPGTTVAANVDGKYKAATVVSVSGDNVLTIGFGGSMVIYSKADCTPAPVKPSVKVGDMVQVPWVGSFVNVKVQKVDPKMGRVWTDDPYSDDLMVIPFGDVLTTLPIEEINL